MIHARDDYNRIQDPARLIGDDEPVFLLRAKDKCAPQAVRDWANAANAAGASPNIVQAAFSQARAMDEWQEKHGNQVPDIPAA